MSSSHIEPRTMSAYQDFFRQNSHPESGYLHLLVMDKNTDKDTWEERWVSFENDKLAIYERKNGRKIFEIQMNQVISFRTDDKYGNDTISINTMQYKIVFKCATHEDLTRWLFCFQKNVASVLSDLIVNATSYQNAVKNHVNRMSIGDTNNNTNDNGMNSIQQQMAMATLVDQKDGGSVKASRRKKLETSISNDDYILGALPDGSSSNDEMSKGSSTSSLSDLSAAQGLATSTNNANTSKDRSGLLEACEQPQMYRVDSVNATGLRRRSANDNTSSSVTSTIGNVLPNETSGAPGGRDLAGTSLSRQASVFGTHTVPATAVPPTSGSTNITPQRYLLPLHRKIKQAGSSNDLLRHHQSPASVIARRSGKGVPIAVKATTTTTSTTTNSGSAGSNMPPRQNSMAQSPAIPIHLNNRSISADHNQTSAFSLGLDFRSQLQHQQEMPQDQIKMAGSYEDESTKTGMLATAVDILTDINHYGDDSDGDDSDDDDDGDDSDGEDEGEMMFDLDEGNSPRSVESTPTRNMAFPFDSNDKNSLLDSGISPRTLAGVLDRRRTKSTSPNVNKQLTELIRKGGPDIPDQTENVDSNNASSTHNDLMGGRSISRDGKSPSFSPSTLLSNLGSNDMKNMSLLSSALSGNAGSGNGDGITWSHGACTRLGPRSANEDRYVAIDNLDKYLSLTGGINYNNNNNNSNNNKEHSSFLINPDHIYNTGSVCQGIDVNIDDAQLSQQYPNTPASAYLKQLTLANEGTNPGPSGYYAVYDGHCGYQAAQYLQCHLHELLYNDHAFHNEESIQQCLHETCKNIDYTFLDECKEKQMYCGSTALGVIIRGSKLYVFSIGDCLACLSSNNGSRVTILNNPHKPGAPAELERIKNANGWITEEKELYMGRLHRMDLSDPIVREKAQQVTWVIIHRVCGELAVSRSIGDPDYKRFAPNEPVDALFDWPEGHSESFAADLVIPDPEVTIYDISVNDDFFIIASDGLWDVITCEDAIARVTSDLNEGKSCDECAENLSDLALKLGSSDNVTIVIVSLH